VAPAANRTPPLGLGNFGLQQSLAVGDRRIELDDGTFELLGHALYHVNHALADIGCVIRDALQVQRNQNQITASPDRLGISSHEFDQLFKNRSIEAVYLIVLMRHIMCDAGITVGKGIECLAQHLTRLGGLDLAVLRLGIVYGPSPVEHARSESQTVVDRFRRLAAEGEELPLDDGGRATIGVVHVEDAARVLLQSPLQPGISFDNVVAETTTVADVAALARGEEPAGEAAWTFTSPFEYRHRLEDYL